MYQIIITDDSVVLKDQYKIISSTTTTRNKYGSYNCSFPYPFQEMLRFPKELYFYERLDRTYITDEEPPSYYLSKKVSLQTRKNQRQKSSSENVNKKWAKMMAIPKSVMGDVEEYKTLHYTLHCGLRDHVTNRLGLLEVSLSKRDLED